MHFELVGKISSQAIIVDDIIDSDKTLVSACSILKERGVREIAIAVTHGIFTGSAWKRLFGLGVEKMFVSNSCPEAVRQKHPNLQIVPLDPLLSALTSKITTKRHHEKAIT